MVAATFCSHACGLCAHNSGRCCARCALLTLARGLVVCASGSAWSFLDHVPWGVHLPLLTPQLFFFFGRSSLFRGVSTADKRDSTTAVTFLARLRDEHDPVRAATGMQGLCISIIYKITRTKQLMAGGHRTFCTVWTDQCKLEAGFLGPESQL
jgi:hypothetical protein